MGFDVTRDTDFKSRKRYSASCVPRGLLWPKYSSRTISSDIAKQIKHCGATRNVGLKLGKEHNGAGEQCRETLSVVVFFYSYHDPVTQNINQHQNVFVSRIHAQ
jgi:hypothetical protein